MTTYNPLTTSTLHCARLQVQDSTLMVQMAKHAIKVTQHAVLEGANMVQASRARLEEIRQRDHD